MQNISSVIMLVVIELLFLLGMIIIFIYDAKCQKQGVSEWPGFVY